MGRQGTWLGVVSATRHKANWVGWGLVTAISRTCFLLGGFRATDDSGKVETEVTVERIKSSQFNTSQGKLGWLGGWSQLSHGLASCLVVSGLLQKGDLRHTN
jgi:hypothetical protein